MTNELKHLGFLIRQGGVPKLLDTLKENIMFDLKHGTVTWQWLEKNDFQEHPENFKYGVRYRATATSEFLAALKKASKAIDFEQSGFFDLGCGKGKVLCLAGLSAHFQRLVGIDYYAPFLQQARQNTEKVSINAEITNEDMTTFTDYDEKSVIYMYNPAEKLIIDKVRKNIEAKAKQAVVIYNKPLHREVFDNWTLIDTKESKDPDHTTCIFAYGL